MKHQPKTVSEEPSPVRLHDPKPQSFGPFITRVVGTDDDGNTCIVTSRRHRKKLQPLQLVVWEELLHEAVPAKVWFRFWAPWKLSWWMAISFMLGSALFGLGAAIAIFPGLLSPWWHTPTVNNAVYFLGSIFFTTAGTMQWLQAVNADLADITQNPEGEKPRWRWFAWRPRNLGYLASFVQLIGTILFNFNTGDALFSGLSTDEQNLVIWTPDMVGSICFLVSSVLAYLEVAHRMGYFDLKDITIWMAILNTAGSIAFQVSAFASFVLPDGSLWWNFGSNWGTFIGGLCFLAASYLLVPELFEEEGRIAKARRLRTEQESVNGLTPESA